MTEHSEQRAYQLRCLLNGLALGVLACAARAWAQDGDALALLRLIPADVSFAVVVKDVDELDVAMARVARRTGLGVDESGLCAAVQRELPLGGWLDLSRPIAFAVGANAAKEGLIVWGHVANLAVRIARSEGATNSDGVWSLPGGHGGKTYLKTLRGYVVAAQSKRALDLITDGGVSLVDVRRGTRDLLRAGDALAHFNMEAHREWALAFVEEMATLGPLTAMLVGRQLEGGGAPMEALLTAVFDGAGELVRQARFVDVGIAMGTEAVDVTCAVSFEQGAVRRYLDRQKPATRPPFPSRSDRPHFLALSYELPSGEAGGGVYLLDKTIRYLANKRGGRVEESRSGTEAGYSVTDPALTTIRVLSRMVRRMNVRLTMGPSGLIVSGDCSTAGAQALAERIRTARDRPRPRAGSTENSMDESLGLRTLGATGFENIPVEWGRRVPALARLMAGDTSLALADVGERTRFCFAGPETVGAFFRQPAGRSPAPRTAAALAALPEHANVVLLVDGARALAVLQRLWGAPAGDTPAPGTLIALSVSLNAGQVQLHLHLPLAAIERLQGVLSPSDHL